MSSFTITTPETSIHLRPSSVKPGANAGGNVVYSVTNTSGSTRRTRLRINPGEGVDPKWIEVRGGDERDIAPGVTESFSVDIKAPGSKTPQDYSFTAVAVNLDDSDNDFERGAAIAFAAPAIEAGGGSKVKWWMIAIPIVAVVLIGGGVLTYFLTQPQGDPFEIAGVVDTPLETARATLEAQGLKVREDFAGETEDRDPEEGWIKVVVSQDPETPELVRPKSKVRLSWDWASSKVPLADWTEAELDEAITALEALGLTVGDQSLSPVSPGLQEVQFYKKIVTSQTPEHVDGLEITQSTPVVLGWEWRPISVTVPDNLVGKAPNAAQTILREAGLAAATSGPFGPKPSDDYAPRVESTQPSPNAPVNAGQTVTLNIEWKKTCTLANRLLCVRQVRDFEVMREAIGRVNPDGN